jgi:hypothetical protein
MQMRSVIRLALLTAALFVFGPAKAQLPTFPPMECHIEAVVKLGILMTCMDELYAGWLGDLPAENAWFGMLICRKADSSKCTDTLYAIVLRKPQWHLKKGQFIDCELRDAPRIQCDLTASEPRDKPMLPPKLKGRPFRPDLVQQ